MFGTNDCAGIPRSTLLIWGHIKKQGKRKTCKSRLLSSTQGEKKKDRYINQVKSKIAEIETAEIEECL